LGIEESPFTKSFQLGTDENFPVSYSPNAIPPPLLLLGRS